MAARCLFFFVSLSSALIMCIANADFKNFKSQFGKNYESPEEEAKRQGIFLSNAQTVKEHNERFAQGKESFAMGVNHLSDLTNDEIKARNGYIKSSSHPSVERRQFETYTESWADPDSGGEGWGTTSTSGGSPFSSSCYTSKDGLCCSWTPSSDNVPASKDWRDDGIVTAVKNQGKCGSCWAFAATGAIESAWVKKYGYNVSLSEQQVIDCDKEDYVKGCNGGNAPAVFTYVKAQGGIDDDWAYPYKGVDGKCRFSKWNDEALVSGCANVMPTHDEETLKNAVAAIGAIAVPIDASHPSFQHYKHGVYSEPKCSSKAVDHVVLLVGYGHDQASGKDYWLIKNSWGTWWGENGFIKMRRNHDNMCGVATFPNFPIVS